MGNYISSTLFYRAKRIFSYREALYYYSYENTDSIMRSKTRKTYIYNRYCHFLAWEEHIRIASIYEADLVPVCTRKALLAAIKALLLYYGIGCKDSRVDFTSVRFYKKASR